MEGRRVQAQLPDSLSERLDLYIEEHPYWTYEHPDLGTMVGGKNTSATVIRRALNQFLDEPPEVFEGTAEEVTGLLELEPGES